MSLAGGKLPKKAAKQRGVKEVIPTRGKRLTNYSEKLFDRDEHFKDIYAEGTRARAFVWKKINDSYRACGIQPGAGAGYCDQVSVTLWDLFGKPKNMRPYSVFFGEEEHVLLYAKKTGLLVDATGNQFGNKILALKEKSGYTKFHKMTAREIQDARELVKMNLDLL